MPLLVNELTFNWDSLFVELMVENLKVVWLSFNFKLDCFAAAHVLNCLDAHLYLEMKSLPGLCPVNLTLSVALFYINTIKGFIAPA